MKTILATVLFLAFSISSAAKYAGEFLYVGAGARGLGMGGAFCAIADDASAGYWNPSGLHLIDGQEAQLMHSERFGGIVRYDYLGYGRSDGSTGYGVSLFRTDVGDIANTNNLEYYDTGTDGVFGIDGTGEPGDAGDDDYDAITNPDGTEGNGEWDPEEEIIYDEGRITYGSGVDWALYLSWSRELNSVFSVGASVKVIRKGLMDHSAFGLGLDVGARYQPSEAFSIGLNLQDMPVTQLFWDTGSNESILPTVKLGLAVKWPISKFATVATIAADGDFRFEGREYSAQYHFNGVSLDTHIGAEFLIKDLVALRIGSSEGSMTAGLGLKFSLMHHPVSLDYAYLSHQDLDDTHRMSLGAGF
ncbi:MAG: hypothetical protein GQ565_10655 [Candidatus Aegiribacteria sp.]|nr:hypothetical protein [Candidatus Aegiribacteria sp.]